MTFKDYNIYPEKIKGIETTMAHTSRDSLNSIISDRVSHNLSTGVLVKKLKEKRIYTPKNFYGVYKTDNGNLGLVYEIYNPVRFITLYLTPQGEIYSVKSDSTWVQKALEKYDQGDYLAIPQVEVRTEKVFGNEVWEKLFINGHYMGIINLDFKKSEDSYNESLEHSDEVFDIHETIPDIGGFSSNENIELISKEEASEMKSYTDSSLYIPVSKIEEFLQHPEIQDLKEITYGYTLKFRFDEYTLYNGTFCELSYDFYDNEGKNPDYYQDSGMLERLRAIKDVLMNIGHKYSICEKKTLITKPEDIRTLDLQPINVTENSQVLKIKTWLESLNDKKGISYKVEMLLPTYPSFKVQKLYYADYDGTKDDSYFAEMNGLAKELNVSFSKGAHRNGLIDVAGSLGSYVHVNWCDTDSAESLMKLVEVINKYGIPIVDVQVKYSVEENQPFLIQLPQQKNVVVSNPRIHGYDTHGIPHGYEDFYGEVINRSDLKYPDGQICVNRAENRIWNSNGIAGNPDYVYSIE